MADTFTTNLNLTKPEVGASTDTWGTKINADLDAVDAIFAATGTAVNVKFASANFDDNAKAIFGTGDDLEIFHDGTDSYVNSNGADLRLKADDVKIYNYAGTEVKAIFTTDGSVDLYHNNVKKFETSATGVDVTGAITSNSTITSLSNFNSTSGNDLRLNAGSANRDIFMQVNGTTHMTVQGSSGNVGIGTASPVDMLTLAGTTKLLTFDTAADASSSGIRWSKNLAGGNSTAASITSTNEGNFGRKGLAFSTGNNQDFTTDAAERMRITSAGNVGIGTSSPDAPLHVEATNASMLLSNSGRTQYWRIQNNEAADAFTINASDAAERMRIDSSGNLGINTTNSGGKINIAFDGGDTSNFGIRYYPSSTASTVYIDDFIDYQGQRMGFISGNTSANTIAYNTSSDYRLKENVIYDWDATTRLKQLKPARFNWIRDESDTIVDGFLAHEVSSIVPESITGDKDGTETKTNAVVNSYGFYIADNITEEQWLAGKKDETYPSDSTWAASHTQNLYQAIDQAKLVPLLVKTIQELEERITTLENA